GDEATARRVRAGAGFRMRRPAVPGPDLVDHEPTRDALHLTSPATRCEPSRDEPPVPGSARPKVAPVPSVLARRADGSAPFSPDDGPGTAPRPADIGHRDTRRDRAGDLDVGSRPAVTRSPARRPRVAVVIGDRRNRRAAPGAARPRAAA